MKTCIVTGGASGLGRAIARALASQGHRVVIVARDPARGTAACGDLARDTGNPAIELVTADLARIGGARAAAEALLRTCERIDVLVHNAGLWPSERLLTEDGFERAFAVNHLAPFVLNQALRERLVASGSRVVQVTAGLAVKGAVDLERAPTGEDFHAIRTYASTKLWNLAATLELARRLDGVGVLAVHPGVVRTGLGDRGGLVGVLLRFVKRWWSTPEVGAEGPVHLATAPELAGVSGVYFDRTAQATLPPAVTDPELGRRVWDTTERLLAGSAG